MKSSKLFWLALLAAMMLGLAGAMFACDDDDDDDDTTGDDDTSDGEYDCAEVYTQMYIECGWAFKDENDNDIALDDVITWCEDAEAGYGLSGDLAGCIIDNWDDCDAMLDCLAGEI
jgi:hypothetical protein